MTHKFGKGLLNTGSLMAVWWLALAVSQAAPVKTTQSPKTLLAENDEAEQPAGLVATYGDKGLSELRYRDDVVVAGTAAAFYPTSIRFRKADGTEYAGELNDPEIIFDAVRHKVRRNYTWGATTCAYKIENNALHLTVSIENDTKDTLDTSQINLLSLLLPGVRLVKGTVDNEVALCASQASFDGGSMTLENWEAERPVELAFGGAPDATGGTPLNLGFTPRFPQHEIVDAKYFAHPGRPIEPGDSDTYHVALRFAPPDTPIAEQAKEVFAHYRTVHPQTLKWSDRRAIAAIYLANSWTQWPKNPRGYLFGKGSDNDVTTPEGHKAFAEGLMAYADQCIAIMKDMDVQGVIVWDIEGQQYWHPLSYVGHPNMLPKVAPEMDSIADAFFKKFRDAGFNVGVCIRPTEIYETDKDIPKYDHRDVQDPVDLMSSKIAYAKKRWGAKYFYLDSDVYESKIQQKDRVPWVMPDEMLVELHKQYPDSIIIPEWSRDTFYAYSAPYHSDLVGATGTTPIPRAIYPDGFTVARADAPTLDDQWDNYVNFVLQGDVLLSQAWWQADLNIRVKGIYQEAGYLKSGIPPALAKLSLVELAAKNQDEDARTRYYVARKLGESKDNKFVSALLPLLDDSELVIQKSAVDALSHIDNLDSQQALDKLMELLTGNLPREKEMLRLFSCRALGKIGEPAVPGLTALAADEKQPLSIRLSAVKALGISKTTSSRAIEALLPMVSGADAGLRQTAVEALGQMRAKEAVAPLMAILAKDHVREEEALYASTATALINIGDKRAVKSLMSLYNRGYGTVVVYWIFDIVDAGLRKMTGQNRSGRNEWNDWWAVAKADYPDN